MTNYSQKLDNLRNRRLGLDSSSGMYKAASFIESAALTESYETRAKTEAVRYALGAMQALESKYTQICYQEGERVRNQLEAGLRNAGIIATFDYQGSVPLNVHIRYASDIDLLVLHGGFVTCDSTGPRASTYTTLPGTVLGDMLTLRSTCEQILDHKFPSATVDKAGAKSISLTGGSLQRKVDVVPSHWHDTATYQSTRNKQDREIRILDKDKPALISNRPFLHMRQIEIKDSMTGGGVKKVIRLLKNLKKDSANKIDLSSYDIASLVWHFQDIGLNTPYYRELSLVAHAQHYLHALVDNPQITQSLDVPDKSRKVIDTPERLLALHRLSTEVDQLALDIAQELKPHSSYGNYDVIQKSLNEAQYF